MFQKWKKCHAARARERERGRRVQKFIKYLPILWPFYRLVLLISIIGGLFANYDRFLSILPIVVFRPIIFSNLMDFSIFKSFLLWQFASISTVFCRILSFFRFSSFQRIGKGFLEDIHQFFTFDSTFTISDEFSGFWHVSSIYSPRFILLSWWNLLLGYTFPSPPKIITWITKSRESSMQWMDKPSPINYYTSSAPVTSEKNFCLSRALVQSLPSCEPVWPRASIPNISRKWKKKVKSFHLMVTIMTREHTQIFVWWS